MALERRNVATRTSSAMIVLGSCAAEMFDRHVKAGLEIRHVRFGGPARFRFQEKVVMDQVARFSTSD